MQFNMSMPNTMQTTSMQIKSLSIEAHNSKAIQCNAQWTKPTPNRIHACQDNGQNTLKRLHERQDNACSCICPSTKHKSTTLKQDKEVINMEV